MRKSKIRSNVKAWTIPATGVRPPFLTLAAVRAIAPVAGIPPKRADMIFPTPWPTNSALERWLPPIMPSETTQERSDSIAARMAMVKAGEIIWRIKENDRSGTVKLGSPALMVYRSPMVLTGRWPKATMAVVTKIATREPGIFWERRGQKIWMSRAKIPIARVAQLILERCSP